MTALEEPMILVLGATRHPTGAQANAKHKAGIPPLVSALFQLMETANHAHLKKKESVRSLLVIGPVVAVMGTTLHHRTTLNIRKRRWELIQWFLLPLDFLAGLAP